MDRFWRCGFRLAHALRRCYWFVVRPRGYGVYIALWAGGRILLVQNSYKKAYTLPCGGIKRGEAPVDAAVRELREEVGVEILSKSLKEVGGFLSREDYLYDYSTVFELEVEPAPRITVDRREVVWAEFLTLGAVREMSLTSVARQYLAEKFPDEVFA